MIISIDLKTEQSEIMLTLYELIHDKDVLSIEDYATELFSNLLSDIWRDIKEDIMN